MEQSVSELINLLQKWENEMLAPNYNPIPTLINLCELFEAESNNYFKIDPDPFVVCHPFRIDPTCVLGQMYKILFGQDSLTNKLIIDYLNEHYWPRQTKDNHNLNVASCRLIMNLIPSLEITVVFERLVNDQIIQRLFTWAENTNEPLQTYATGILATCMELTDIASNLKDNNQKFHTIILDRLHSYYTQFCKENEINQSTQSYQKTNSDQPNDDTGAPSSKKKKKEENCIFGDSNSSSSGSNVSYWVQIYPPNLTTKLVYCFKYLATTGEYQMFLSHAFEKNVLNLVMKIIGSSEKQNSYLTLEALKYLAALLCDKQIATEFIGLQGLQKLLRIPKPSIQSTGVLFCFYRLSYCEEALERICLLPEYVLVDLVRYALSMLECSNDSSIRHATMFFSYSFHFSVIQEIFDNHDGLRKLCNVVSTLPILSSEDSTYYSSLAQDAESSARQILRLVCAGLKHYFEAHLHIKAQQIRRTKMRESDLLILSTKIHHFFTVPGYKSTKKSHAEVQEEIELLSNTVSLMNWAPIDQLLKLGGLSLLLQIINLANKWNFSERCEMIKNALEVLNICAVLPKVQLALCEIPSHEFSAANQNDTSTVEEDNPQAKNDNIGLNIIIKAAGDPLDADIQKAALSIIITCVCAPMHRKSGSIAYYSSNGSNKKRRPKTYDDAVIKKIWDCFKNNNGIIVLLTLMTIKTSITDVNTTRVLASRALAGLARSESVCQIISKLPLFNSGKLQSLLKNPVMPEQHQEHVTFQKYALELIQLVSGEKKSNGAQIQASTASINQAKIVSQTKINFNEQQFLLLMYQHLMAKGLSTTAELLVQEANLNIPEKKTTPFPYNFHCRNRSIGGGISPMSSRQKIQNKKIKLANSSNGPLGAVFGARGTHSTPKRLNIIRRSENQPKPEPEQELESPMSKSVHEKSGRYLTLPTDNNTNSNVTLESIVTEYLTNQHASCEQPIVTCPQFNLLVPHKCPDPKPNSSMCTNFAMRFSNNIHSRILNHRLIYSRFYPTHSIYHTNEFFSSCVFLSQNRVALGSFTGKIIVFNLSTSQEELSFSAHRLYIHNLQCSNNKKLLLSSSSIEEPLTCIWSIAEDGINFKYSLDDEIHCTFSNYDQIKILGTKAEIATIYDLETSKKLLTLVPRISNQYRRNRAVFDATNQLVLSDGVLWDAIAGKEIHRFDKLSPGLSGVFHPNGLEIISNKEIYDVRTFRLLHTEPMFDKCEVKFSKSGEILYSYVFDRGYENCCPYQTKFQTFDTYDYSDIGVVDVHKLIYDMACNSYDTQIAIVENQRTGEDIDNSSVQIYDVGRMRHEDEVFKYDDDNGDDGDNSDEEIDSEYSESEDENMFLLPKYLSEMIVEEVPAGGMNDNISSDSSSNTSYDLRNDSAEHSDTEDDDD